MTHTPSRVCEIRQSGKIGRGRNPAFDVALKHWTKGKLAAGWIYLSISQVPGNNLSCFTLFFKHIHTPSLIGRKKIAQNPTVARVIKTILKKSLKQLANKRSFELMACPNGLWVGNVLIKLINQELTVLAGSPGLDDGCCHEITGSLPWESEIMCHLGQRPSVPVRTKCSLKRAQNLSVLEQSDPGA